MGPCFAMLAKNPMWGFFADAWSTGPLKTARRPMLPTRMTHRASARNPAAQKLPPNSVCSKYVCHICATYTTALLPQTVSAGTIPVGPTMLHGCVPLSTPPQLLPPPLPRSRTPLCRAHMWSPNALWHLRITPPWHAPLECATRGLVLLRKPRQRCRLVPPPPCDFRPPTWILVLTMIVWCFQPRWRFACTLAHAS